ncbi:MAG: hypothetical protein, partial [Olavius algarvensis Gamma 1 endosymbiont]
LLLRFLVPSLPQPEDGGAGLSAADPQACGRSA